MAATKPFFIGIGPGKGEALPQLEWNPPDEANLKITPLNETHKQLGAKMVAFAGWEMPVRYTSVLEEHRAVRSSAGLFDVSHMGVFQVEGPHAAIFLNSVCPNDICGNDVHRLRVGTSLYTHFLNSDARVIDDLLVYRRSDEVFMLVVNAANEEQDWTWLRAVREGKVRVDNHRPWSMAYGRGCRLRNLKDPAEGDDQRVDLALQGPQSREILLALGCAPKTAAQLKRLPWAGLMEATLGDFELIVSRTGYTGERVAYEIFVHPEKCVDLWIALLDVGGGFGLKPAGLGARDSLRTEAGLPLHGHEMAGEMELGVGDAGFGNYVKIYKPWFIGRDAFIQQENSRDAQVARFRFNDKGVRMAHYGDPVVDKYGQVIGRVTSCAVDQDGYLTGQAYLKLKYIPPGTPIAVFSGASGQASPVSLDVEVGQRVSIPSPATVLTRFLQTQEELDHQ